MAQTIQDTALFSDSTGQELKGQAVESEGGGVDVKVSQEVGEGASLAPTTAGTDAHAEKAASQTSTDGHSNDSPSRPSLVPLGSTHTQTSTLTPVAPHPKRFSAVNINKKFLEKNTTSGSAASSATSSAAKSGAPSARASVPPTLSHSRLVTAKLTASPAVASSTAGWSRPSSVAPSPATTSSPISTSPLPTAAATQPSTTSAPQLPHAGKVILPQPRAAMTQLVSSQKDTNAPKPVWGNIKSVAATSIRPDIQSEDFPTAAEVAQSNTRKLVKPEETKVNSDQAAAKQLRSEEADTFRGIHLDPNAHHWDEMEEDDDNFLDGVIEFGDGRQYKIESNDAQPPSTSPSRNRSRSRPRTGEDAPNEHPGPVSKEDRFVDDFDRSWPKSRTSPATAPRDMPSPVLPQSSSPNISAANHGAHAHQDASRVLFNERSNRLEPYGHAHAPGQGAFTAKRPGHPEGSSPVESRNGRYGHPVVVLQKPGANDPRARRYSSSSSTNFNAGSSNVPTNDRSRRDVPPPSPRMTRDPPPHTIDPHPGNRDFDSHHGDRGRRTNMGPPPVPAHTLRQDAGRQLPPHLSQVSPDTPSRRLSSRDSRFSPSESSAGLPPPTSARLPPQSPALSHASLSLVSPAAASNLPLPLTAPELDEVRKDLMHSAAERAKQRRQQEEAEREAQKERAHRKAAEIEEKLKAAALEKEKEKEALEALEAAKLAKEKEAIALIEEAVKSAEDSKAVDEKRPDSKPPAQTPGQVRPAPLKQPKTPTIFSRNGPPSAPMTNPTAQPESWRAPRVAPLPPPTPRQIQPRPSPPANFVDSGPSASEQVETIAEEANGDLEVVDFSEMGKFVGVAEVPKAIQVAEAAPTSAIPSKPSRPLAADFFDEPVNLPDSVPISKQADFGAWRRKVSQDLNEPSPPLSANDAKVEIADSTKKIASQSAAPAPAPSHDHIPPKERLRHSVSPDISTANVSRESQLLADASTAQTIQTSPTSNAQRTPRGQGFYHKEAAMSALDDAMLRIKGVLVGMHAQEPSKEVSPKDVVPSNPPSQEVPPARAPHVIQVSLPQTPARSLARDRWVPPALRPRRFDEHDEPRENFLFTVPHLPHSPDTQPSVKLPAVSYRVEFIHRKLLQAFARPPYQARMDILSFEPPVPDMNRRDLSLNDVLFRKPPAAFKGKFRYRVSIPRFRGPKVSMPAAGLAKPNGGAFGRPTLADGVSTWRKPTVSPSVRTDFDTDLTELNTMSRSPPPDHTPPPSTIASIPKSSESSPAKSEGNTSSRSKSQLKMPEGSAVAFIRDSRIDVVEADTKPRVNFIVGSQLDDSKTSFEGPGPGPAVGSDKATKPAVNGISLAPLTPSTDKEQSSISASVKDDNKTPDEYPERVLVTPPTHHASASWTRSSISLSAKESPARAPDPEHLKAVWSQTSNKAGLHPVNSLEGIADDLTALPFTLQDVKSEDGETPPPSLPSAPSRMSIHDVTRAFQTVPTSSSTSAQSPHRASFSPPSTQAPVARPSTATYGYSPVPQQNNMPRPTYVSYPSPMISHSPAPVMYGHPMAASPVPSRMQVNGHTPLYSQPMWVTMPAPSPGSMMRTYPGQMISYPSPGYAPQPPPNMMPPGTPQAQNGGRGRGPPIMSPAMYTGSPVMLHAVQVPQNHGFMPGRGQPRADNGQMPAQQQHLVHHPVSHNGFNAGPPPSPFVRSQW